MSSNGQWFVIAIIAVIVGILWYNSDLWPWPSGERIYDRLEEVIDTCSGNEDSRACKNIQDKYNMTFKYCSKFGDFSSKYGVAWEGKSSTPPKRKETEVNGIKLPSFDEYFDCKDHIK